MAIGYRPSSKDRSTFKTRNQGDGGLSQIRQRDAQVVQGMENLRNQTEEIGTTQIAAMRRVNQAQIQNREDIKATIEDKSYQLRREAISRNRDREYQALMQRSNEAGREAKTWEKLTPTLASSFKGLADSYYEQAENNRINQAHEDQTETSKLFATINNEALKFSEIDALADANIALAKNGNLGEGLWITGGSPWLSVGRHDVHARRETSNLPAYWQSYQNSLQRDGVVVDSTNIGKHVDNFRALILKINGWENTKSQGVQELNEAITQLKTSKIRNSVNSENEIEGSRQYKFAYENVTSTNLSEHGISSLIQRKMLVLNEGKLPNMGEAIQLVFVEDLAKDLSVPIEDIYAALDFLTPEKGRQEKYPTYNKRNANLRALVRKARAEVSQEAVNLAKNEEEFKDLRETKRLKSWLDHTGDYAPGGKLEGQGWDGTSKARLDMYNWAKQNNLPDTATFLESYAPFDETNYRKGLQLEYIGQLVDSGDWQQALELIENSPLLTTEDRNKAKIQYLPVLQHLATAGTSEEKIEDTLESLLLTRIGGTYVGSEGKTNIPSLEGAIGGGKTYLMERFKHHDLLQPDTEEGYRKALELAWSDTKKMINEGKEGFAQITEGIDAAESDISYFTKYQPLVNKKAIRDDEKFQKLITNNPIIIDKDGSIKTLGAWEQEEILTTEYLYDIAAELKEGRAIVVPGIVLKESIRTGIPVDILINAQLGQTRKYKGKQGSFGALMKPGPRDIALQGVSIYPGYLNVKDRIAHANGLFEIQRLTAFVETSGNANINNRDPLVNQATVHEISDEQYIEQEIMKAVIASGPEYVDKYIELKIKEAKERSGKEEIILDKDTILKWTEIKKVCQECNIHDIDFSQTDLKNNRYKLKAGSDTEKYLLRYVAEGLIPGVYCNAYTNELILEKD